MLVLRSKIRDMASASPANNWEPLVKGSLDVYDVPGGHTTHIDIENSPETARILTEQLAIKRANQSADSVK